MGDGTERESRLDQLLSRCGYASRRKAGYWVRAGRVRVDDEVVRDAATKVDPCRVRIDGEPLEAPFGLLAMLHKPSGVVCSRDDREGASIYDLLPPRWSRRNPPVTSVGRLDRDTTGLVLVTDLGELVHRWTSPRHHVEKVYEVILNQPPSSEVVDRFASGTLRLEGERRDCGPARLELLAGCQVRLTLEEGKYHQVKRMFAAVGLEVRRLHRPRFGPYELGDLAPGNWRWLELPTSPEA